MSALWALNGCKGEVNSSKWRGFSWWLSSEMIAPDPERDQERLLSRMNVGSSIVTVPRTSNRSAKCYHAESECFSRSYACPNGLLE